AIRRASASRSGFAPHVIAYWFRSASIARFAASLIAGGAGKSGKPWARLTAPCCCASRVIARITDSVKTAAFADVKFRPMRAALPSPCERRDRSRASGARRVSPPSQERPSAGERGLPLFVPPAAPLHDVVAERLAGQAFEGLDDPLRDQR